MLLSIPGTLSYKNLSYDILSKKSFSVRSLTKDCSNLTFLINENSKTTLLFKSSRKEYVIRVISINIFATSIPTGFR